MPPIVQKNFCPIYRIDYLITKKSYTDKISQGSIRREISSKLGISLSHFSRIRKAQVGSDGYLSTADLVILKDYFNCTLDDLVVASSPDPDQPPPQEAGGTISDDYSGLS